jgi:hypothetical protein
MEPSNSVVTMQVARAAWNAIRLIDGAENGHVGQAKALQAFKNNRPARYASLRLQKALKSDVDFSEDELQKCNEKWVGSTEAHAQVLYEKERREILKMPARDVPEPGTVALKLSLLKKSIDLIPSDLLMDLGPFLIDDLQEEPAEPEVD